MVLLFRPVLATSRRRTPSAIPEFHSSTRTSNDRNQVKLTGTIAPGHTLSGSYMRNTRSQNVDLPSASAWCQAAITVGRRPNDLFVTTYRGSLTTTTSSPRCSTRRSGSGSAIQAAPRPTSSTRRSSRGRRRSAHYNAPYFDATDPEDRNNRQLTGNVTWFLSSRSAGSHSLKAGFERYTSTNTGGNSQTATGYVFRTDLRGRSRRQPAGRRRRAFDPDIHDRTADIDLELARDARRAHRHQHHVVLRERRVGARRAFLVQPGRARRDDRQ